MLVVDTYRLECHNGRIRRTITYWSYESLLAKHMPLIHDGFMYVIEHEIYVFNFGANGGDRFEGRAYYESAIEDGARYQAEALVDHIWKERDAR